MFNTAVVPDPQHLRAFDDMCEDIFKTYPDWVNRAAIPVPNYFDYVDDRPWPLDKKKRAKRAGQA